LTPPPGPCRPRPEQALNFRTGSSLRSMDNGLADEEIFFRWIDRFNKKAA
jgi:hypothetical protein